MDSGKDGNLLLVMQEAKGLSNSNWGSPGEPQFTSDTPGLSMQKLLLPSMKCKASYKVGDTCLGRTTHDQQVRASFPQLLLQHVHALQEEPGMHIRKQCACTSLAGDKQACSDNRERGVFPAVLWVSKVTVRIPNHCTQTPAVESPGPQNAYTPSQEELSVIFGQ
eukprot:1151165-Pelagomonas_calceolata.AAC.6